MPALAARRTQTRPAGKPEQPTFSLVCETTPELKMLGWRLEWQKRGGRAGEDWVITNGILVADEYGVGKPLHIYLRGVLNHMATVLSAPSPEWADPDAICGKIVRMAEQAHAIAANPIALPDHYAAYLCAAMLVGNFDDAVVALCDVALGEEQGLTLAIDAHTLGIIAPRSYIRKRARIENTTIPEDYYAVPGPDRADAGWQTATADGALAPRVIWSLMNALNVQFDGTANEGKQAMRQWCASVTRRFLSTLDEEGITREEFSLVAAANA